jgi:preprotein translocase subunit SecB
VKKPKFVLETLFYPEISIKANSDYDSSSNEHETEPVSRVFLNKVSETKYQVGVGILLTKEVNSDPYNIEALGLGVFTVDEKLEEEDRLKTVVKNGPNLVYGGLREFIATVTGRGPYGEYFLPATIFEPSDFDFGEAEEAST